MFAFAEKYKTPLQVMLGVIALSFVGLGVGSYNVSEDPNVVAEVGGQKVSRQELAGMMQNLPSTPEARAEALKTLISQRLQIVHAQKEGMAISDAELAHFLASQPALQENGQFSKARYEQLLKAQGMSAEALEAKVRHDLLTRQLVGSLLDSAFVSQTAAAKVAALLGEQREVLAATIAPAQFREKVKLGADAAKQYYDAHLAEFKQPEQVRVKYVVLSQQAIADQQVVSEDELHKYFDEHKASLGGEERKVAHILLSVAADAPAAEKEKVKAKAEALLKEVQATPGKFAELARQQSQDPGSAAKGGDLGYYAKGGGFVKPFEDAVFAMNKGEIKGLLETQFGYHILKLEDVKTKGFDDVRPQIEALLKGQKASQQFQGVADKFNDVLYNQPDSLEAAAGQFKLEVKESGWLARGQAAEPELNNPKVFDAVFTDDVVKKKHNSEAVEIAPGKLLAAHVLDYRAAGQRPLAEVQDQIIAKLAAAQAQELAIADGKAKLADLVAGKPVELAWGGAQTLSRQAAGTVDPAVLRDIFKADGAKLPMYAGGAIANGFVIYKITKAVPVDGSVDKLKPIAAGLAGLDAKAQGLAYLKGLESRYKVEIRKGALERE